MDKEEITVLAYPRLTINTPGSPVYLDDIICEDKESITSSNSDSISSTDFVNPETPSPTLISPIPRQAKL